MAVPERIQELIGGLDGANFEVYDTFTKLHKDGLQVLLIPPRTCVVTRTTSDNKRTAVFPNLSIASHHVGPAAGRGQMITRGR